MGTPEFAVPALRQLNETHEVQAVFCQPDRPKGRSKRPVPCPVKAAALELGLPVHQPKRVRARKWVSILTDLAPDLIVVAAFGQILPQSVLDIPTIDCINIHASLLPRWRGASPIHHAILAGDAKTGVGIMRVELALDAGPVYSEGEIAIDDDTTREQLEVDLAQLGADLLIETIPKIPETEPRQQNEDEVTYAPIIEKSMGYLDFARATAREVFNGVRAFSGWPGSYCRFADQPLKLVKVRPLDDSARLEGAAAEPGTLVEVTKKKMVVACAEGTRLEILELQPSGKKVMPAHAFINGHKTKVGDRLEPM
ncbi:methionyl-tRNA formyltransferase [Sulfidibacter corallicola]